ncbi:MAG TPA: dihydrolipoyllysine-residue acetyltransferase [Nevskiaceae bacterium]|nr:dihydrolipoyllysine-residue acetyltransferase [Nevskiaceae bacterium]
MTEPVKVPDIGDYTGVPVIEVLVKDGDSVAKDQPLIVLESDKATMEVPSPAAGTVRGMKVKVGDKVSQGDVICELEEGPAAATATKSKAPKTAEPQKAAPAKPPPPPPQPKPAPTATKTEARIPDIGDYSGVPVIEVLVKEGDRVEKDAPLIVLESDKATMEVPSPAGGIVRALKSKIGDKVSQGDLVCTIEGTGAAPDVTSQAAPATSEARLAVGPATEDRATKSVATPAPVAATAGSITVAPTSAATAAHAGPATRKFARELGVDLAKVPGTGRHGRVTVEDVQAFVKKAMSAPQAAGGGAGIPPIPVVDFSQFGEVETKPLSRIRKLSKTHLHRAWLNVPHVTQFDEADITDVEAFRKSSAEETGKKLTLLPFIMKAAAKAMDEYPEFRSSLAPDGESLIMKKYCHIGFAADTEHGLVVPVVRDVDRKGVVQLADECGALAKKARDGKLKPDEMKGGCFSISSLGGIGGSFFTPIVNAPEVAILGASRAQMKPMWTGKAFEPRLLLPLSLSYDHRVIDGAYAARFIVLLVKLLSDVRRLAL